MSTENNETKYEGIKNEDSFGLKYYEYKQAFFGSHKGMRYRITLDPFEKIVFIPVDAREPHELQAVIWPEPYSYDNTDDEKKVSKNFPYTEEGKVMLIEWLNEQYIERKSEWETAAANAFNFDIN